MKIIDLLNKLANGEEIPNKIKFNSMEYKYDKEYDDYYSLDVPLTHLLDNNNDNLKYFLNDTVEIIEDSEEKKIKKLEIECEEITDPNTNERKRMRYNYNDTMNIVDKINELVKEVNKLKE